MIAAVQTRDVSAEAIGVVNSQERARIARSGRPPRVNSTRFPLGKALVIAVDS